jgi:tetratricopeptide (TPR) repeat protein
LQLTAASAAIWFKLCFLSEYREYLERALRALQEQPQSDEVLELQLNVALAQVIGHTRGSCHQVTALFQRTLEIARRLGAIAQSRRAFWGLWIGHVMAGEYSHGVVLAEEFLQAAQSSGEAASAVTADRMMMVAHHLAGNQVVARHYGERVLKVYTEGAPPLNDRGRKYDQRVAAYGELARILWMQGFSEQALTAARRSIEHAESFNHALSLCRGLSGAAVVMLWTGDLTQARRLAAQLLEHSTRHSLGTWQLWARCLEAALTQQRTGNLAQVCFELSHHPQCSPFCIDQMATLSEGLVTREALSRAKAQAAGCCTPEILRAGAENLLSADRANAAAAELMLQQALRIARDHGALSWELRAAMSLCRLWVSQGRIREARDLLVPVHARFAEGFETQDLVRAQMLLGEIQRSTQPAHRLRSG